VPFLFSPLFKKPRTARKENQLSERAAHNYDGVRRKAQRQPKRRRLWRRNAPLRRLKKRNQKKRKKKGLRGGK